MQKTRLPELLAPAGSMEGLKAAINAGADAVYLGGKRFSARYYAVNFNDTEIKEAVDYAHIRRVKVYLTVNTLIKDNELEDVAEYLFWLYKIGIDAVLVQDLGVAAIARELTPNLNLHASTQMTIHNLEGVLWAKKLGFKRVVLARELVLDEIKKIANNIGKNEIELEIFAHGALCYSYSGQCLFSSVIGGRSGNRGMCAQPCRKPYKLLMGKRDKYGRPIETMVTPINGPYFQSTRDLALYSYLDQIVNAPINSIKIEGRMKSPEYVAIVVSIYRKALDSIALGEWKPLEEDLKDLKLAFNRGFTKGYILGARGNTLMGCDRPDNRGIRIGEVIDYEDRPQNALIRLKSHITPQKGDGLVLISPRPNSEYYADKEKYGMVLQRSPSVHMDKIRLKTKKPIKPGTDVYLTREKALTNKAKKIIKPLTQLPFTVPVDISLTWLNDGTPVIHGKFPGPGKKSFEMSLNAGFQMKKAISHPLNQKQIETQFRRTGDSPFKIREIKMRYPGDLFAPLGILNQFRREFLKEVEKTLITSYQPDIHDIGMVKDRLNKLTPNLSFSKRNSVKRRKIFPVLAAYTNTLKNMKGAVEGGCKRIYFEPFIYNQPYNGYKCQHNGEYLINNVEKTFDLLDEVKMLCDDMGAALIWKWPHITSRNYLDSVYPFLNQSFNQGICKIMVDGIGVAESILGFEPRMQISGSFGLNIWNHWSINQLSLVFKSLTLSPELSKDELLRLVSSARKRGFDTDLELVVQGNMEIVVSEDCLPCTNLRFENLKNAFKSGITFWGLQDIKKRVFPMIIDNECRTHLLNSVEMCLVDHIPTLVDIGLDTLTIDSRGRTYDYAKDMSMIYGEALDYTKKGDAKKDDRKLRDDLNSLKDEIKRRSIGGITIGNFIRGIKE